MRKISTIPRPRRRGATTIEYILILIFFVIPIVLWFPRLTQMLETWGTRLFWIFNGPFP
jgi:Flp pilus assembly pilin Flp